MKNTGQKNWLKYCSISALISMVLSFLVSPVSAGAQSLSEYFQISYDPATFSQTSIVGSESFSVTIHGRATCSKDLPVSPSEASISSRIVARNMTSGTVVTLNSSYTVEINPVPSRQGQVTDMTQSIPLQFPAEAESGAYSITAEIIEAKVRVLFWIPVTGYFPESQSLGTVTYTASIQNTGGAGGGGPRAGSDSTTLSGFTGNSPRVNISGYATGNSELITPDGKLKLNIPDLTRLLNAQGTRLDNFTARLADGALQVPESISMIMAYDLGPDGARFEPAISLTYSYNIASLPAGVAESSLYIAWKNGSKWDKLESTTDNQVHTISARISHFSTFALLGQVFVADAPPPASAQPPVSNPALTPTTVSETQKTTEIPPEALKSAAEPVVTSPASPVSPGTSSSPNTSADAEVSRQPVDSRLVAMLIISVAGVVLGILIFIKKRYSKLNA